MRFDVWAPVAKKVELELDGKIMPMQPDESGHWSAEVEWSRPGMDYAYRLDGGPPLPDPRSNWQPHGVHGPSRLVDHASFAWEGDDYRTGPLSSAVLYELHVGTFTPQGTFDAAAEKLDHLQRLGVTHVELLPVNEFAGSRGWGYDGVDLYAPHHAYGGPDGLKRLVRACHRRGLGVILDVVYNHFGPDGCYLSRFGPYFTDRYATPWGKAVNLDQADSEPVRRFILDSALTWLEQYRLDGLRVDGVHAIVDTSAVHILEQLVREVRRLEGRTGRPYLLIGESDLNNPRVVQPPCIGGYGMDAQWSDDFHHALHTALTGERDGYYVDFAGAADLAKALREVFVYEGKFSVYRRRRHGRPVAGLGGESFLGYSQNHDQVGNRAAGERLCHLASAGKCRIAASLVLTSPFVPMLFAGEEWAASTPFQYFTDFQDPQLAQAVVEGRRKEFALAADTEVPNPQEAATFQRSRLDWSELSRPPHDSMLEWYRRLIDLRRSQPDLLDGDLRAVTVQVGPRGQWLAMRRKSVLVLCNFADEPREIPTCDTDWIELLSSDKVELREKTARLPGESVSVLRERPRLAL